MGAVRSLHPTRDLEDFCEFLYGKNTGYVYMPLKDQNTGQWEEGFYFKWPEQKQKIIEHVQRYGQAHNVYISPALFGSRSNSVEDVCGSQVAWAEFDGSLPTIQQMQESNIPMPSLRVKSSKPGREHWYWRYDKFQTEIKVIQDINKALTYKLGADFGGWFAAKVLRPVGSVNHKYDEKYDVVVLRAENTAYSTDIFSSIPVPEDNYKLEDFDKKHVPNPVKLLFKYSMNDVETNMLMQPSIKEGARSSALFKLGCLMAEKGLDNNEIYSLLEYKDSQWGKYSERPDKERWYVGMINAIRVKIPYVSFQSSSVDPSHVLPTMTLNELMESPDTVKWLIDGILPDKGLMFLVGKSGSGKTLMSTGLCMKLALGSEYLGWRCVDGRPLKIFYLSLEMNIGELKVFFDKQLGAFNQSERDFISPNFRTYAAREGEKYIALKFYNEEHVTKIIATIKEYQPDIILVDSATKAIARNMSDSTEVPAAMEVIYRIRNELNTSMIVIHHTRKNPPAHGFKDMDIDDMFGAQALQQDASSIIAVVREKDDATGKMTPKANITYLKTRFTGDNARMTALLDDTTLMFKRPTMAMAGAPLMPTQNSTEKRPRNGGLSF